MGTMPCVSNFTPVDDDYRERQCAWLDSLSDKEFAELARSFFERFANADAQHKFFLDTEDAFDLACRNGKEI